MCDAALEAGEADESVAFASNQEQREAAVRHKLVKSLGSAIKDLTNELISVGKEAVKSGQHPVLAIFVVRGFYPRTC